LILIGIQILTPLSGGVAVCVCVDWRNTLRYEAATKRKRQPEIARQLAI
jgi:hypothetical protein